MPAALNCPNCGAPIQPGPGASLTLCLYCNTAVRLQPAQPDAPPAAETALAEADMAAIKQMMLDGKRDEALRLYQQQTGVSTEAAGEAIGDLGRQVSLSIIRRQRLTPAGVGYVALYALTLVAGILLATNGTLHPILGYGVAVFGGLQLLFLLPTILISLRFLRARPAIATTLRLAPIGVYKLRGQLIHTFKVLVEVQPNGEPAFQGELLLPVRAANLPRAQPGARLHVRYLPDASHQIIFDRPAETA